MQPHTLEQQKKEILLLVDYAAPPEKIDLAKELVERYQADKIALNIFQEFNSYLPEAENDYIKRLQLLENSKRTFLMLVTTHLEKYIYLATLDQAVFLGRHQEGIWDEEVLTYFNTTREKALKKYSDPESFPDYISLDQSENHCLACTTGVGEYHRLGCPVEICPWCNGQLTSCNCRFSQMGVDTLKTKKQIDAFKEELNKKGRIPFEPGQRPGGLME